MVFSSLFFLYFFLPLCLIFYQFPRTLRGKNTVLLVFSLFFYSWGEPIWILQMVLSGFLVWFLALRMDRAGQDRKQRRSALRLAIAAALIPLLVFKYSGFFVENVNAVFGAIFRGVSALIGSDNVKSAWGSGLPIPAITMPIGISFYTFQIISYAVDLYRGRCGVQQSFADFLLYESLFPQLIAGPIVRYRDIEKQLYDRKVSLKDFTEGTRRFVIGLAKKALLANQAGALADQVLKNSSQLKNLGGLEAWLGIIAFTFQIYFDFSAYSDMAIGLGRLFGFRFLENFNYPYISRSITEFWRRWHMSLSSFFRDYVYIPLGGNRRHLYRNLLIVWFLTGFWHGASWNFILWGLYYLLFLLIEKAFLLPYLERLPRPLAFLIQAPVILIGWSVFYFTRLSDLFLFWNQLFCLGGNPFLNRGGSLMFRQNIVFFILCLIASMPLVPWLKQRFPELETRRFAATPAYLAGHLLLIGLLLFLSTAALAGASFNPFLYFRF